jgi:hypothetical protein
MDFRLYLNAPYFPHGHFTLLNNYPHHLKSILQLSTMLIYFHTTMISGILTAVRSADVHSHGHVI